jgi:hypothetical protein
MAMRAVMEDGPSSAINYDTLAPRTQDGTV